MLTNRSPMEHTGKGSRSLSNPSQHVLPKAEMRAFPHAGEHHQRSAATIPKPESRGRILSSCLVSRRGAFEPCGKGGRGSLHFIWPTYNNLPTCSSSFGHLISFKKKKRKKNEWLCAHTVKGQRIRNAYNLQRQNTRFLEPKACQVTCPMWRRSGAGFPFTLYKNQGIKSESKPPTQATRLKGRRRSVQIHRLPFGDRFVAAFMP